MTQPQPEGAIPPLDETRVTLSANLYCDRHFHEVLRHVLAPLLPALEELGGAETSLWFSRYSRRGQHVKVRIHSDDDAGWPALRDRITELASAFFASLPKPEAAPLDDAESGGKDVANEATAPDSARLSVPKLPPIDLEDEGDSDYPDRSILWTAFRPSPKTLGHPHYLSDPRHLGLFYRALAASARQILVALPEPEPPLKARQARLLRILVSVFFDLDFSADERIAYLEFHRDWMLRHQLTQAGMNTRAEETLERLDQKLLGMEGTVAALSEIIAGRIGPPEEVQESDDESGEATEPDEEDESAELRAALQAFLAHAHTFRGQPSYDVDPYTSDYSFLPLFKVLHGIANQIGVPILNELYTYQILVRATGRAQAEATSDEGVARHE